MSVRTLYLVATREDGTVVNEGDEVGQDSTGQPVKFVRPDRARVPGKSGKVEVVFANGSHGWYYDNVYRLRVSGILTCGCDHWSVWTDGHRPVCEFYGCEDD